MSFQSEAAVEISVLAIADKVVTVRVAGELDLAGAPQLEALLMREISAGKQVVLDLSELAFIDCSGLHAILSAAAEARRNGGELKRTPSLRHQTRRLLDLARVQDALPVVPA
jgi:anti-anti-sigma factor